MPNSFFLVSVGVAAIAVFSIASRAPAEQFSFTVDPVASSIQASGSIPLGGIAAEPQAPGSDLTTYSGDVLVDLDDLSAPTAIEFVGGSIAAADSGNWLPDADGGSVGGPYFGDADPGVAAPANYGLFAEASLGTLWLALRDIVISPDSDPLAISEGAFESTLVVNTTRGWSDYNFNAASILFGDRAVSYSMEGVVGQNMAGDGSYEVDAGVATITMPVDILFVIEDEGTGFTVFELSYIGTIVATRSITRLLRAILTPMAMSMAMISSPGKEDLGRPPERCVAMGTPMAMETSTATIFSYGKGIRQCRRCGFGRTNSGAGDGRVAGDGAVLVDHGRASSQS